MRDELRDFDTELRKFEKLAERGLWEDSAEWVLQMEEMISTIPALQEHFSKPETREEVERRTKELGYRGKALYAVMMASGLGEEYLNDPEVIEGLKRRFWGNVNALSGWIKESPKPIAQCVLTLMGELSPLLNDDDTPDYREFLMYQLSSGLLKAQRELAARARLLRTAKKGYDEAKFGFEEEAAALARHFLVEGLWPYTGSPDDPTTWFFTLQQIREMARKLLQWDISTSTLRFYIKVGLLPRAHRGGGVGWYPPTAFWKLIIIQQRTKQGFSLVEIREKYMVGDLKHLLERGQENPTLRHILNLARPSPRDHQRWEVLGELGIGETGE